MIDDLAPMLASWPRCSVHPCVQQPGGYEGRHHDRCYFHAKVALRLLTPWTPGPSRQGAGRPAELPYIPRSAIGAHR